MTTENMGNWDREAALTEWLNGAQEVSRKHALLIAGEDMDIATAIVRGALHLLESRNGDAATRPTNWKPISEATQNGKMVWLGWKPFLDSEHQVTSGCEPKRGHWDIGSKQWVCHWEDHGDAGGHRPMPFDPQPDYFVEGFEPTPPTA